MRVVPGTGAVQAETGAMQRLKQHNLGANLRVNEDDLLIGFRVPRPRVPPRFIKLHVGLDGDAERAYYEICPSCSHFPHCRVNLTEDRLRAIQTALRLAYGERPRHEVQDDPNRVYRTLEFRDDGQVYRLVVEDDDVSPSPDWPALDAV